VWTGWGVVVSLLELSFLTTGDELARSKAAWSLDNEVGSSRLEQAQWEGPG
jgi:hypothetical protein